MVKFLIIRFSSIGDIVLTTPVIRCLKEQVEGAEVHFIVKQQYSSILSSNPYIDKLWLYNNNFSQIIRELRNEQFDFIVDLHHNLRTFRIKNRLNRLSFSFDKLNVKKWILVNFKINLLPDIHIVDRYLETLKLFDVKNDGRGLDYFIHGNDKKPIPEIRFPDPKRYIALCIGARHCTKKAPAELLSKICDRLKMPVIILGDKNDTPEAMEIFSRSSNKNILDLTGKLSLGQSAFVISSSQAVITHDSGLMHIAAAFKKNIISIWGNTVPEFGMYPYKAGERSRIFEVKGLRCRPCSKLGYNKCPRNHFNCMMKQDVAGIAEYVNNISETTSVLEY